MATPSADIAPPPTTRASSQSTRELDHAVAERHQRADARRNREKILAAAEVAFRELGTAVQMEDIARRAEVGVGTLYRHFPTKEHLVAELATHRFSGCISEAEMALATVDVWAAIECFVYRNAEQMATDAGLRDTFMAACQSGGIWAGERDRLNQTPGRHTRRCPGTHVWVVGGHCRRRRLAAACQRDAGRLARTTAHACRSLSDRWG